MNVFLTGSTGFLGEYLLAELLGRGHRVWGLYRSEAKRMDTVRFLSDRGLPRQATDMQWIRGDLLEIADRWSSWVTANPSLRQVETLLHCAASMKMQMDAHGEPLRTNVGSARVLKRLTAIQPMAVHIVSTAYVCGRVVGSLVPEAQHSRGNFVNVYEESKWEAEQLWTGEATLLRPSIIVGDSITGRCTSFFGWYVFMQAVHLLGRLLGGGEGGRFADLRVSLPVDPDQAVNIIPVDYVAQAAVRIIENPANHRGIFHLTHPDPPTHERTWAFVAKRCGVTGLKFGGAGADLPIPRDEAERMVFRQMQAIVSYIGNNPVFSRAHTDSALSELKPPDINENRMNLWIDYAIAHDWGQ